MAKGLESQPEQGENKRSVEGVQPPATPLTKPAEKEQVMADFDHSSTPGKSPSFQFYANDFIAGTRHLTAEEVGVYIRLLCWQWDKGLVPNESKRIANIASVTTGCFRRVWPHIRDFFQSSGGGYINERLERERAKQAEYRRRQSDASHKRWDKPKASDGNATALPTHMPNASSPVFSLRSSSSEKSERAFAHASPSEAERAGNFVERYRELHRKYRNGATYVNKHESFDFAEALILVKAYPDERLDLLARVWFQADDEFATSGTRTMAKFRSRVSWCEEQLIAFEQQQAAAR